MISIFSFLNIFFNIKGILKDLINRSKIKIISEKQLKNLKPDYLLVLPWHFKDHILKREHKYLKSGGKFIFPLPDIEII